MNTIMDKDIETKAGYTIDKRIFEQIKFIPAVVDTQIGELKSVPCHVHMEHLGGEVRHGWILGYGAKVCDRVGKGIIPCFLFAKMSNEPHWVITLPVNLLYLFDKNPEFVNQYIRRACDWSGGVYADNRKNFGKILDLALQEGYQMLNGEVRNATRGGNPIGYNKRTDKNGNPYFVGHNIFGDYVSKSDSPIIVPK